jgi:DNA-binding GntR family transcriptional regulator
VRRGHNSGYTVAGLNSEDIHEICDVLRLLDTALFIRAAENLSDDQSANLEECVERMAMAASKGDLELWSAGDARFHELLQVAAGHTLISDLAQKQRRRLHWFWMSGAGRLERLAKCADEHSSIAKSIAASDDDGIRRLVNEHIDHMEASMIRHLEMAGPFISTNGSALDHV